MQANEILSKEVNRDIQGQYKLALGQISKGNFDYNTDDKYYDSNDDNKYAKEGKRKLGEALKQEQDAKNSQLRKSVSKTRTNKK